jgi:hypothetical protein
MAPQLTQKKYLKKKAIFMILRLSMCLSKPCIFAIFKHIIFKFWILIEDYTALITRQNPISKNRLSQSILLLNFIIELIHFIIVHS